MKYYKNNILKIIIQRLQLTSLACIALNIKGIYRNSQWYVCVWKQHWHTRVSYSENVCSQAAISLWLNALKSWLFEKSTHLIIPMAYFEVEVEVLPSFVYKEFKSSTSVASKRLLNVPLGKTSWTDKTICLSILSEVETFSPDSWI